MTPLSRKSLSPCLVCSPSACKVYTEIEIAGIAGIVRVYMVIDIAGIAEIVRVRYTR